MKRKFIEYDLPLKEISHHSAKEKNIRHGHPSTMHIWWARRPLAASRATAFASMLDDPGENNPEKREEIYNLIKNISPWTAVKNGNSEEIIKAQNIINNEFEKDLPKVLDPFAGGGAIPQESLRLGGRVFSSDYNPIAVLIEKASIEWPQKYGFDISLSNDETNTNYNKLFEVNKTQKNNFLAYMVEKWAKKIYEDVNSEINKYYPTASNNNLIGKREIDEEEGWTPVAFIWARTITCQNPSCKAELPLIRQFWLSKKKNKKIAYKPKNSLNENKIEFEIISGQELESSDFNPTKGTINQANAKCLKCGQVTESDQIRDLAQKGKMAQRLILTVYSHPNETGKKYKLADSKDEEIFKDAQSYLEEKLNKWSYFESPLPNEDIPTPDKKEYNYGQTYYNFTPIVNYNLTKWKDLFNDRQKLSLVTFMEKIKDNKNKIKEDCKIKVEEHNLDLKAENIFKAIMGYLGIMLDTLAEHNSNLCRWIPQNESFAYLFSRQAFPMMWDYPENNPFSGVGGDWHGILKYILKVIVNNSFESLGKVENIEKNNATNLPYKNSSMDLVLTDPPYYDNVPYSVLSDFFYVWLKRCIGNHFPNLFNTSETPKSKEAIAELPLLRGMRKEKAKSEIPEVKTAKDYENLLLKAFNEMFRVLKSGGTAIIVYAHKTTVGWETMINSLIKSGFVITASWPIHTEKKGRLRAVQSAALASSIYMVCRKTQREELGFWDNIKPKIEEKVKDKLHQFWNQGIKGGDFFISAIGPGMEEYSKYERVEKYSGEEVDTLELLQYIRGVCADYMVDKLLEEEGGEALDQEAQFYLTYRWTYLDNKVPFDDGRKIASAEGVDLSNMWGDDDFVKKTRKYIRVLGPHKRNEIKTLNNMVDVMHKSVLLWEQGNKEEIEKVLNNTGYLNDNGFWQFCQAVAETLPEGKKEKRLLEGFLTGRESYEKKEASDDQMSMDFD